MSLTGNCRRHKRLTGVLSLRIIVAGAGKLGFETARLLAEQSHDVVVIDLNEEALISVTEHLDVLTVHGNGAAPKVLREAGVAQASLLIAVTGRDEVNLIACFSAKRMGVSTCAARVRNPEHYGDAADFAQFGVDAVFDPDRATATEIARLIKIPKAMQVDYFAGGRVSVIGLHIAAGAPITRGPLKVVRPGRFVVACVVREGQIIIPRGDTVVRPGDRLYAVTPTGDFGAIRDLAGAELRPPRTLTVVGGGRIGRPLLRLLVRSVRKDSAIKLIERNPDRCAELAREMPDEILIIQGDGTKLDILAEAAVQDSDALIAVTGDDGTNLLGAMAAKRLGVGMTVAALSRQDYLPLAEGAGVDACIVPRLVSAGTLLQLVRKHPVVSLALLEDGRVEAAEVVVEPGAPAAGCQLQQLKGMQGTVIGAVVRRDEVIIPDGSTRLAPGDHVVSLGLSASLPKAQTQFRA